MRVNPTDSIPAVTTDPKAEQRVEPRRAQTTTAAVPDSHVEHAPADSTSVVVEIQKDNELIYRFVDTSTGKLIQQIPSQQLIDLSQAIDKALNKPDGSK